MPMNPQKLDKLQTLIDKVCDGSITAAEFRNLNDLLRGDADAQQIYIQHVDLINSLRWRTAGEAAQESMAELRAVVDGPTALAKPERTRWRFPYRAVAAAAAIAIIVAAGVYFWPRQHPVDSKISAKLAHVQGKVHITSADGKDRSFEPDVQLRSGDTIKIGEEHGSAVLRYTDGTELTMRKRASLTVQQNGKKIFVRKGVLSANVQPQSPSEPVVFATPNVDIELLGTRFTLSVTAGATELKVHEGRVRLTRRSDRLSVEVASGEFVVAKNSGKLVVRPDDGPHLLWSVDFESGLPKSWASGKWVTENLPPGSRGAVQTAISANAKANQLWLIASNRNSQPGLFTIQDDCLLQFAYKLRLSGPMQVFLIADAPGNATKTATDPAKGASAIGLLGSPLGHGPLMWWPGAFAGQVKADHVYVFDENAGAPSRLVGNIAPDRWHSAGIPIASFRAIAKPNNPPPIGTRVSVVLFSTGKTDRGLTIDRISVTRGGLKGFHMRRLP